VYLLTVVLTVLLAVAMGASAARKARGAGDSRRLRDRLGVAPGLWLVIGALELAAVLGLLAGLAVAPLGVAAGTGVALLMAGAVAAHLRRGIAGRELAAPLLLTGIAVVTVVLRATTA